MSIQTRSVEIQAPDGAMPAHLAEPEGAGPHPAVVVIMEAFGAVPHVHDVAERLAGEGYVAIAPDFYYRELPDNKVGYDELPRAIALMQKVDDAKFTGDMRATLAHLHALPSVGDSKIGVTGFCMGGRLTFLSACELGGEIAAAAPFYGGGITGHLGQADRISCPLQLFFGDLDAFIPVDQVEQIDAKLKESGAKYDLQLYEGANHGFFCNERGEFHEAAAADAWSRLKTFFASNLR
jgi:carboxymethylenebutenolidase